MDKSRILILIGTMLLWPGIFHNLLAQEVGKLIKSEQTYNLTGLKERPDLESYSPQELEDYIAKEIKYDIQKEITYDRSGRVVEQKDFRRAGLELTSVETTSNYAYSEDTITCTEYNEDGTLRLISRYKEKNRERQMFQHSVFRVPEIMTPGVTSKPRRKEMIHYYNLAEEAQQRIVNNIPDNYPVELFFKSEIQEDGLIKKISSRSKGAWPPNLLKHKITNPKTGKSVFYHCLNTYEEIDLEYFPQKSDTIYHRIYKKSLANFGPEKNKSPNFHPDHSVPGATTRHEEWLTIQPNDSLQIKSHFTLVGAKDIRKVEQHYLHHQLIKLTESILVNGLWKTPYSRTYFRHKNFSVVEQKKQNGKRLFKSYYLTFYEYY